MASMIPHQLPPTLEQRRAPADCLERAAMAAPRRELSFAERREAIREYREASWSDDYGHAATTAEYDELANPYAGPFVTAYLDALSAAEREALCANGEPVELSAWQMLREEYEEATTQFLLAALVWVVALGIGLVAVAVRNGWIQ